MTEKNWVNRRNEYRASARFPKEDDKYLYFYLCKNDTYQYIDIQQRLSPYVEIIPMPNLYPYDSTINVQIKISKDSNVLEWLEYTFPSKGKAMVSIMGIPIAMFACALLGYDTGRMLASTVKAMKDTIDELMQYYNSTKEQLYELIVGYYGSEVVWQEFGITFDHYYRWPTVWDRPSMPPRIPNQSYDAWYNTIWVSELRLYNLVKAYYSDAQFHYSEKWLRNQHLDIFSPGGKIAFEYQGKQHYESISYFGGEKGFQERKLRDNIKRNLCKENGITLIEWSYETPIFPVYLLRVLRDEGIQWEMTPSINRKEVWEDMPTIKDKTETENIFQKEKKRMNKVIQRFSKEGVFEKEYRTIKEAVEDTGLSKKGIEKVLYGERKTCGGYVWKKIEKEK